MLVLRAVRHPTIASLALLNALGGIAVLASYVWGLGQPAVAGGLWGGVPEGLRPLYTGSMFGAAAGYFPFTHYLLMRLDPEGTRLGGSGYGLLFLFYGLILIPSALWLPLTAEMLAAPSDGLWWTIRTVLFGVAAGSLGILWAVVMAVPRRRGRTLAIVGALAFCLQTVALDALVWPWFFPR
jgi:hypothetical protein